MCVEATATSGAMPGEPCNDAVYDHEMKGCMPGMCMDFGDDLGMVCMECADNFVRRSHGVDSGRFDPHCIELHINECWTQPMKDNGDKMYTGFSWINQ